jgi:hypothetical protein
MNARMSKILMAACVVAFAAFASSCAVEGGGYYGGGPSVDVGVGFDYYDSGGYYGGWGPGYRVGPVHHDGHWDHNDNHGRPPPRSYHPAPSGHRAPSIPSRPRSSGGNRRH